MHRRAQPCQTRQSTYAKHIHETPAEPPCDHRTHRSPAQIGTRGGGRIVGDSGVRGGGVSVWRLETERKTELGSPPRSARPPLGARGSGRSAATGRHRASGSVRSYILYIPAQLKIKNAGALGNKGGGGVDCRVGSGAEGRPDAGPNSRTEQTRTALGLAAQR